MSLEHRRHLSSATDLITSQEATRAGFVSLALEKSKRATPAIEEARALHIAARRAGSPLALAAVPELEPALLTAAGISQKAAAHLKPEDRLEAIQGLIANFLEPAGAAFADELVYRFLLVRGDALGGAFRNLVGLMGKRRLGRAVLAALSLIQLPYQWLDSVSGAWISGAEQDVGVERNVGAIAWTRASNKRLLMYDMRVPLVRKNVDLCLLAATPDDRAAAMSVPNAYLALGELKGGFDPAGADEHWKTANTALSRVRSAFTGAGSFPKTFFVGGAIVRDMSNELWDQLESGQLSNAANLTAADQVSSLCAWIVEL